jgi:hypothetical protein
MSKVTIWRSKVYLLLTMCYVYVDMTWECVVRYSYGLSQNCKKRVFAWSCLSVLPIEQLGFHWTDFDIIWYVNFLRKYVKKVQVTLKSDKSNGHFTWKRFHIYDNISLNCSQNEKFLDKIVEKIETHILWSVTFSRKSCRLLENVEKFGAGRPQMT